MERLLLTVGRKKCPFQCAYCFTDFSQYERPPSVEDAARDPRLLEGVDVIYPACDVDLFALRRWPEVLRRAASLGPSISLSTKAALDSEDVSELRSISEAMGSRGAVLKVAVSISTRRRCRELEPRAPGYEQRLESLALLAAAEVKTALVVRPLLVDVPPAEYESILESAAPFVSRVLTGPEHLDDDLDHVRRLAPAPHPTPERRIVRWAVDSPRWESRNAPAQEKAVRLAAERLGLRLFESDIDLMAELLGQASTTPGMAATG